MEGLSSRRPLGFAPRLVWLALLLPPARTGAQGPTLAPQESPSPLAERVDDHYPPRASTHVVRFYALASETPDLPKAAAALAELGASIAYGPRTSRARPGASFLALRVPIGAPGRELGKALARSGATARELSALVFDGHRPDFGIGADGRDDALAMFSSVAWIDCAGAWTQMYLEKAPAARDARAMIERYGMMYEQNLALGQLARESFVWPLARVPDEKAASRVLRAVRKLEGVEHAALNGARLTVTVELRDVRPCGDSAALARPTTGSGEGDAEGRTAPRATWCTQPLHDLLTSEGWLAAPAADSSR